jgi:DNA-binding beta-propeller fold protein YncE
VQVFERNGAFVRLWGRPGAGFGEFNGPAGIAVRRKEVYVADRSNNRVQVFNHCGTFLRTLGSPHPGSGPGQFAAAPNGPVGAAVHRYEVYATDFDNNRVQVFHRSGRYLRKFNTFNHPNGVAVFDDEVYVTERDARQVQVWLRIP